MKLLVAVLLVFLSSTAYAAESTSKQMSFDACLKVIQKTSTQLGVSPINIVETTDVRMVKFSTNDGSVMVTCSRLDGKMVTTVSK